MGASKRRRTAKKDHNNVLDIATAAPVHPDAILDLNFPMEGDWQGWAEIESEPAFFNVMLKELGVCDVSVREIFSLDQEMLAFLPRPVYGVIFLFKWRADEEFTDTRYKAGAKVWFANQTVSNACATFALLNIINNIPDLDLGPQLENFKIFTKDFTPALRGDAVTNFEFVKKVHNSFARKMDKLNGDLHMKNGFDTSVQESNKRKRREDEGEASHHFIAFMPIQGVLWKMDGLEWQPRSLGKVRSEDWVDQVKSDIKSRMSRYEDNQIEFAILGLVKDPIRASAEQLAKNVKALMEVRRRLKEVQCNSELPAMAEDTLLRADTSYGLTDTGLTATELSDTVKNSLEAASVEELRALHRDLSAEQESLRLAIREEQKSQQGDEAKAARRRHDYGDAVHHWLKCLVRKHLVRDIMNECAYAS